MTILQGRIFKTLYFFCFELILNNLLLFVRLYGLAVMTRDLCHAELLRREFKSLKRCIFKKKIPQNKCSVKLKVLWLASLNPEIDPTTYKSFVECYESNK